MYDNPGFISVFIKLYWSKIERTLLNKIIHLKESSLASISRYHFSLYQTNALNVNIFFKDRQAILNKIVFALCVYVVRK